VDENEQMQRAKQLKDELEQLEGVVGITPEAAEKAWGLAFWPYGISGDKRPELTDAQNTTLYFDNEHDDKARRVRNLYFGVADADVRRKLITKVLELDDLRDRSCREHVDDAKRTLWQVQQKEGDLGWLAAASWGIGCVLLGYWIGNIVGAIAGAVAGVFVGLRIIFNGRTQRHAAVTQATESVADAEKGLHQLLTRQRFFTPTEGATGTQDESYFVNAFGERVREFQMDSQAIQR
jgi:hypothetical protein